MFVNKIELLELKRRRAKCKQNLTLQKIFLEKYKRDERFYAEMDCRLNNLPKIKSEFNRVQYNLESCDPINILQHMDFREKFLKFYHEIDREFREIQQMLKTAKNYSTSRQGYSKQNQSSQQIEAPTRSRAQECIKEVKAVIHEDNMMNTCDDPVSSTIKTRSMKQSPQHVEAPHSQSQEVKVEIHEDNMMNTCDDPVSSTIKTRSMKQSPQHVEAPHSQSQEVKVEIHEDNMMNTCDDPVSYTIKTRRLKQTPKHVEAPHSQSQEVKVEIHEDNMMNTCDDPVSYTIKTRRLKQSPKHVEAPHSQSQECIKEVKAEIHGDNMMNTCDDPVSSTIKTRSMKQSPQHVEAPHSQSQEVKVEIHEDNMMNTCDDPVSYTIKTRSLKQSPKHFEAPHSQLQDQDENLKENLNRNNDELVLNNHEDANQLAKQRREKMESISSLQLCNDASNQILPSTSEENRSEDYSILRKLSTSGSKSLSQLSATTSDISDIKFFDYLCSIMSELPKAKKIKLHQKFINDVIQESNNFDT